MVKNFKIYESGYTEGNGKEKDEDDIKNYLKNFLSSNVNFNVLIGSGASLPAINTMGRTFNDIKTSGQYTDELSDLKKKYTKSYLGKNDENFENIELFLSWLGNRINGADDGELNLNEKQIKYYIINELIKSIYDGFDNDSENNRKTQSYYESFLKRLVFLKEMSNDQNDIINIFTPNYDLFLEQSLDKIGFSYTDGFRNSFNPYFDTSQFNRRPVDITQRFRDKWSVIKPFFRIYKLHGSLNWKRDQNGIKRNNNLVSSDTLGADKTVIAPTSSKYADSQGSPFSDLFREFSIELTKPNSILLVNGFGFGDQHINDFIKQALQRTDFKLIAFVDEDNKNTLNFMQQVGPNSEASFITNGKENEAKDAHHFETLSNLLSFNDPFEVRDDE
ncbi:SIR2 family protein [Fructilactobacillus carniphilus]|uniref:SIR2 family protein n=1 Tax=Fructilactobacillus carniphilus TaxID=2940297 RepID=A0ABY5BY74_9LACO|nr:SIR2 family protein [Fructilactobacillus carniphilus]USS90795.1 SIR2 family protein [Fructilactobacillus carniphilus]